MIRIISLSEDDDFIDLNGNLTNFSCSLTNRYHDSNTHSEMTRAKLGNVVHVQTPIKGPSIWAPDAPRLVASGSDYKPYGEVHLPKYNLTIEVEQSLSPDFSKAIDRLRNPMRDGTPELSVHPVAFLKKLRSPATGSAEFSRPLCMGIISDYSLELIPKVRVSQSAPTIKIARLDFVVQDCRMDKDFIRVAKTKDLIAAVRSS